MRVSFGGSNRSRAQRRGVDGWVDRKSIAGGVARAASIGFSLFIRAYSSGGGAGGVDCQGVVTICDEIRVL
jgi:hypothetical protein